MSKLTQKEKPKLMNQGAYGCIFKPGIKCDGKTEKEDYVTKIQKNSDTVKNEIKISEKIKKIKDYQLYFSPIVSSCLIELAKVSKYEINKCNPLKNNTNQLVSNKIKYVGDKDLTDIIVKNPSKVKYLYNYLLETLLVLEKNNIVHYDIKSNNIIFDNKLKIPILIDFGVSFHTQHIHNKNVFYNYSNDYDPWCIDIAVCSFIETELDSEKKQKEIQKEQLELLIYRYEKQNPIFKYFSESDKEEWKKNQENYFYNFINKSWKKLQDDLSTYHKSWDNYSLSVLFFEILHNKPHEIPLLKKIILQSPDKRLLPSTTTYA